MSKWQQRRLERQLEEAQAREDLKNELQIRDSEFDLMRDELNELRTQNYELLAELKIDNGEPVVPILDAVYFSEDTGKYFVPAYNTLRDHYNLVYDRTNELDFWKEQCPAFDGIVAQTFLEPGFSKPNHPDYFDYEPLRDNVATLRNFVLMHTLEGADRSEPMTRQISIQRVEEMAREVGVGLQRDSLARRPGSHKVDVLEASEPGVGAAKLYELLVDRQNENNPSQWILDRIRRRHYDEWGLPPVEQSPFSAAHVEEFCIARDARIEQQKAQQTISPGMTSGMQLAALGAAITGTAVSIDRVRRLPRPVRDRAVELARDILDKMKIDVAGDTLTEWLEHPAAETVDYAYGIAQLSELYANSYTNAITTHPEVAQSPFVLQANEAVGKLAYMFKQQAATVFEGEGRMDDAALIRAEASAFPPEWQHVDGVTIDGLLSQLQAGIEITYNASQQIAPEQQAPAEEVAPQTAPQTAVQQQDKPAPQQQPVSQEQVAQAHTQQQAAQQQAAVQEQQQQAEAVAAAAAAAIAAQEQTQQHVQQPAPQPQAMPIPAAQNAGSMNAQQEHDFHTALAGDQAVAHSRHEIIQQRMNENQALINERFRELIAAGVSPEELQAMQEMGSSMSGELSSQDIQRQRAQGSARAQQRQASARPDNFVEALSVPHSDDSLARPR